MPSPLKRPASPAVAARSIIKPQLANISGSGRLLDGVIVERNRERGNADVDSAAVKASQHLLVVPTGAPARLTWRQAGAAREATFAAGELIVNPLGLFLAPRWSREVELLLVALNPALVQRVAEELGRQGAVELLPRVHVHDELIAQLVRSLAEEFERDVPADRVYAESLAQALAAHLVRHHSVSGVRQRATTGGLPPRTLARLVDYVHEHLAEPLSLDTLARVAGVSPSHLTTAFKRSTGLAPHQFLMTRRLERATTLLEQTRLPIADVARRTGFADQSHLTRLLRRHSGLTPRLIRGT